MQVEQALRAQVKRVIKKKKNQIQINQSIIFIFRIIQSEQSKQNWSTQRKKKSHF